MFQFAKQPLSILKIWKAGFSLYKTTFTKIWFLALLIELIYAANQMIIELFFSKTAFHSNSLLITIFGIIILVFLIFIGIYFYLLPIHRMYYLTLPNEPLQNSFQTINKKYWTCVLNLMYMVLTYLAFIALFIIVLVLFAFLSTFIKTLVPTLATWITSSKLLSVTLLVICAIPFIWLFSLIALAFLFNFPLILLANNDAWSAVKTGFKLIWGNLWRISLGIFVPLLIIIIPMIIYIVLTINLRNKMMLDIYYIISIAIGSFALIPLQTALILVQFNDLKLRKK